MSKTAYDIASRIPVSEFPGQSYAEREANARIVLAALTPAQAEPVAWLYELFDMKEVHQQRLPERISWTETPLYADPPAPPQAEYGRIHTDGSRSGGQPPQDRGERAAIVAWLRAVDWCSESRSYANAFAEQIEQGLHHRAQALADLAEGDAELIGGGD